MRVSSGLSFLLCLAAVVGRADDPYGGSYGGVSDVSKVRGNLRAFSDPDPVKRCKAARDVRKAVFGEKFDNENLTDFMVYVTKEKTYGPVLSSGAHCRPHLFGAHQVYVVAFSDESTPRYATLTTLRPKAITPIELALQAVSKIGLGGGGEKDKVPAPQIKKVEMRLLAQSVGTVPPPLYVGVIRFPVEPDTSNHIGVGMADSVEGWTLERKLEARKDGAVVKAILTREGTGGTTKVTEEIPLPVKSVNEVTDEMIARYAKILDESVAARTATKTEAGVSADSDAAATLDVLKFPVVEEEKAGGGSAAPAGVTVSGADATGDRLPPIVSLSSNMKQCEAKCDIQVAAAVYGGTEDLRFDWPARCVADKKNPSTALCHLEKPGESLDVALKVTDKKNRVVWAHYTISAKAAPPEPLAPLTYKRSVEETPKPDPRAGGFFSNSDGRRISLSIAIGGTRIRKNVEGAPTTTATTTTTGPETSAGGKTEKTVTITETITNPEPPLATHVNAYVLAKLYVLRPRLEARDGRRAAPYSKSVGVTFGGNLALNELVVGLSLGHIVDRVGLTAGRVWVTKSKEFFRSEDRWFVGLEYSL
jgi:hypothetical protein